MGGCLSKCGLSKSRVCEDIYELHDDTIPTGAKWAEKRNKALTEFIGKGTEDVWSTDVNEHWSWPSRKPRVVVSPMHDDVCAMMNDREQSSQSSSTLVKSCDSPDNSAVTLSDEDNESVVTLTPDDGPSQPLDGEAPPTKSVNANIRTLLQLKNNTVEEHLAVIDIESADEFEIHADDKVEEDDMIDDILTTPRPSMADLIDLDQPAESVALIESCQENVVEKVVENNQQEVVDNMVKEPEVDNDDVNILQPINGPGVMFIQVRPKTPEEDKIEFITKPKTQTGKSVLPAAKKSQMVPKHSEIESLDKNDHNGDLLKIQPAIEADSDLSSDTNGATNSIQVHVAQASEPPQALAAVIGESSETVSTRKKPKKMRPRKAHPNNRSRVIPQSEFIEVLQSEEPEPTTSKKNKAQDKMNYEDSADHVLKPFEKARATEGQILGGTLITWPKYMKERDGEVRAQPLDAGVVPFRAKMAWGKETTRKDSPIPGFRPRPQINVSNRQRDHSDASRRSHVTPITSGAIVENDGASTSQTTDQSKVFGYRTRAFFDRLKVKPDFMEKKLSSNQSTESEDSEDGIDFSFTPENLRRYAKRRQEKLRRRPKTPFHRKAASTKTKSDKESEVTSQSVDPTPQSPEKSSKAETALYNGPKCVSFVIPVEHRGKRPPTSRPNTRSGVRPKTPRADAKELALRQANAKKRREQAMKSRGRSLRKKTAQERERKREEAARAKTEKLKEKMEKKMKRHRENRNKKIDKIVAKQTEHIQHVKDKHDVVFTRKRFLGLEKDTSPDPNTVQFTLNDIMEIDRFFDEMDK